MSARRARAKKVPKARKMADRRRKKPSRAKMVHVPIKGPRCNETLFVFIDQNKTIYAGDAEHVKLTGAVVFVAGVACQVFFKQGNKAFTHSPYSLAQGVNAGLTPEAPDPDAAYAIGGYPTLSPMTGPIIVVP